ncbi:MAG: hypothetical protein AAF213_06500 [Pseudomonadota bacterium]
MSHPDLKRKITRSRRMVVTVALIMGAAFLSPFLMMALGFDPLAWINAQEPLVIMGVIMVPFTAGLGLMIYLAPSGAEEENVMLLEPARAERQRAFFKNKAMDHMALWRVVPQALPVTITAAFSEEMVQTFSLEDQDRQLVTTIKRRPRHYQLGAQQFNVGGGLERRSRLAREKNSLTITQDKSLITEAVPYDKGRQRGLVFTLNDQAYQLVFSAQSLSKMTGIHTIYEATIFQDKTVVGYAQTDFHEHVKYSSKALIAFTPEVPVTHRPHIAALYLFGRYATNRLLS